MMDYNEHDEYFSADEGEEDRDSSVGFSPDSRRRTLEPRETVINMIGSEMQTTKGSKHAVFVCEVVTGIKVWRQRRRFREFVKLDREIVKRIADSNDPTLKGVWLPIMPPKSITKSSDDPDLVRLRCVKLEEYLRSLVELHFVWDLPGCPLAEFLDDDSGTLSVLVELSRLRVWRNALALDKNPTIDSVELESLRSSLSQVDVELFQRLGNENSPDSSEHTTSSSSGPSPISPRPIPRMKPLTKPPPPTSPPPKYRHSVDEHGNLLVPVCLPSPVSGTSSNSSSTNSNVSGSVGGGGRRQDKSSSSKKERYDIARSSVDKDSVLDDEVDWLNKQAMLQSLAPAAASTSSLTTLPASKPPSRTSPPIVSTAISSFGASSDGLSASSPHSPLTAPVSSSSSPSPYMTDPSQQVYDTIGLRNTISDMRPVRPVPETLQEARELIKKTQRSLSGTMLMRTRELSVSARKTPASKALGKRGAALSKISDSSPPSSPSLTSQSGSVKGVKNQSQKIKIDVDELRFSQGKSGSSLAKEFEDFNLESYSEYHRPSDLSDDIHGAKFEEENESTVEGNLKVQDVAGGEGSDPSLMSTVLAPASSAVNKSLSSTFPPKDYPVTEDINKAHISAISSVSVSEAQLAPLPPPFTPLTRMSPVRRQTSDEVATESASSMHRQTVNEGRMADSNSSKKQTTTPSMKKNAQQVLEEFRSSESSQRINIPISHSNHSSSYKQPGSFSYGQRSPPRQQKKSLSQQSSVFGSFASNYSFSSSYSNAAVSPPLPTTPPPLPTKEDILNVLSLFEQDISSLLFPQLINAYSLSVFKRSSPSSHHQNDDTKSNGSDEAEARADDDRERALMKLWLPGLTTSLDELVGWIQPNSASLVKRKAVFEWVEQLVKQALGAQLLSVGSFPQRTYLPDSDLDLSAMLITGQEDSWFVKVNEALCLASIRPVVNPMMRILQAKANESKITAQELAAIPPYFIVRNFSFINGKVKIVKASINNIAVDVSANQAPALYAVLLIDHVDNFFGKDHLFKRSLLLVKSWAKHESSALSSGWGAVLNSKSGGLTTAALNVIVMSIFNRFQRHIEHPIHVLALMLLELASFDYETTAMTMYGPIPISNALDGKATELAAVACERSIQKQQEGAQGGIQAQMFPRKTICELAERVNEIMLALEEREASPSNTSSQGGGGMNTSSIGNSSSSNTQPFGNGQHAQVRKKVVHLNLCYRVGCVNVIDPLHDANNLATAVDATGLSVLRHACARGFAHFNEVVKELSITAMAVIVDSNMSEAVDEYNDDMSDDSRNDNAVVAQQDVEFSDTIQDDDDDDEREKYQKMSKQDGKILLSELGDAASRSLFPRTWEMYGDGFRDDLRSGGGGGGIGNMSNHSTNAEIYTHTIHENSSTGSFNSNPSQSGVPENILNDTISSRASSLSKEHLEEMKHYAHRVKLTERSLLTAESQDHAENAAKHAELILASKVNPDALARLVIGIIESTGPLPVGEVGKQLQEVTGNSSLSSILKDQFGGLKKFLEAMSQYFVVGDDHPFNPHVRLLSDGPINPSPSTAGTTVITSASMVPPPSFTPSYTPSYQQGQTTHMNSARPSQDGKGGSNYHGRNNGNNGGHKQKKRQGGGKGGKGNGGRY